MTKSRKNESNPVDSDNVSDTLNTSGSEIAEKKKRGRPKGHSGRKPKVGKRVKPKTMLVDGKVMKRAVGRPKKVKTGKTGRQRKEYVWVEAK